jgi:hypothetical protein
MQVADETKGTLLRRLSFDKDLQPGTFSYTSSSTIPKADIGFRSAPGAAKGGSEP